MGHFYSFLGVVSGVPLRGGKGVFLAEDVQCLCRRGEILPF